MNHVSNLLLNENVRKGRCLFLFDHNSWVECLGLVRCQSAHRGHVRVLVNDVFIVTFSGFGHRKAKNL